MSATRFFCLILLVAAAAATATVVVSAQRTSSWPACDPLAPQHCLSPFPNDFYAIPDPTSNTGLRVNMSVAQTPQAKNEDTIDPVTLRINSRDGFGNGGPIMFSFSDSVETVPELPTQGSATWKNIAPSLDSKNSPSLLIDLGAVTPKTSPTSTVSPPSKWQLFPHWIENDVRSGSLAFRPATLIYAAKMMAPAHRYAVVVRNLRHNITKKVIQPSDAFAQLLSGQGGSSSDPSIATRAPEFMALFSGLESQFGIPRSSLQLAWFFTTASDQSQLSSFQAMQKDAMSRVPPQGPNWYITKEVMKPNQQAKSFIYGQIEVPLYLTSTKPGGSYVLDPTTGLPTYQGLANFSFIMSIPNSFNNGSSSTAKKTGFLHAQHGLFLNLNIINQTTYQEVGNDDNFLVGGVNWLGLCTEDIPYVLDTIEHNISQLISVPDRLSQALINVQYLSKMFLLSLPRHPRFAGKLDLSRLFYTADSLGGIMGLSFMTASNDVNDAVLRVNGAPFGLLLPRSWAFGPLWDILVFKGYNTYDRIVIINLIDFVLEVVSGPAFARHLIAEPFPGNVPKRIASLHGLSDALVTMISGEVTARTLGCNLFTGNVFEEGETPFGFGATVNASVTYPRSKGGCLFQLYNFSNPPIPDGDSPVPLKYNTHGCPRDDPRATMMMRHFFSTGEFKDFCGGTGCYRLANSTCS